MTEAESKPEGNVEATINAVTGLAKAVPIYQDTLQPAAQEIGKAFGTIAKTVNVALSPVSALIWGYDQIKDFVDNKVTEKLQGVPEEDIITPPPHIVAPALESLRYTGSIDELKDLYANLIASSMDSSTTEDAHPSFVEIIKQLSSTEAKLLTVFISATTKPIISVRNTREDDTAGFFKFRNFSLLDERSETDDHNRRPNQLDNLCRLGLIEIPDEEKIVADGAYKGLEEHPFIQAMVDAIDQLDNRKSEIVYTLVRLTGLGRQFVNTCVRDHRSNIK